MTEKQVVAFCDEREVNFFTHYDNISNTVMLKMQKRGTNLHVETSINYEPGFSKAFELSFRLLLKDMANELDKMMVEKVTSS